MDVELYATFCIDRCDLIGRLDGPTCAAFGLSIDLTTLNSHTFTSRMGTITIPSKVTYQQVRSATFHTKSQPPSGMDHYRRDVALPCNTTMLSAAHRDRSRVMSPVTVFLQLSTGCQGSLYLVREAVLSRERLGTCTSSFGFGACIRSVRLRGFSTILAEA